MLDGWSAYGAAATDAVEGIVPEGTMKTRGALHGLDAEQVRPLYLEHLGHDVVALDHVELVRPGEGEFPGILDMKIEERRHHLGCLRVQPIELAGDIGNIRQSGDVDHTSRYRLGEGQSASSEGWNVHAARHGPAAAFRTMAASPASLPDAAGLTAEELDAIVEGSRTPVAIAQAGRLVREAGAGTGRLAAIAERLADAVERWGELFGAVLRWSAAKSTLDRAWSGVEPARRLALLWLHADWLLDAFIQERFEPAGLVGSFAVREEELDALDRIAAAGAGPADQADPTGITPQVLLLHGMAAILGDLDAGEALAAPLADRLDAALRREGGVVDPSVLLRRPELGDALDGFLTRTPAGLPAGVDPSAARDEILDRALEAVTADPADHDAWLAIVAFASRGLEAERTERLAALIDSVDHFAAAALGDAEPQPFVWRGALAPLAWGGVDISGRIAAIARRCARQMAGPVLSGSPAELAMSELVETSLLASRTPDGCMDHGSTAMLL